MEPIMSNPKLEVLTPQNSQLIFIDHQPQMAFGVQSIDRQVLKNNTVALAKAPRCLASRPPSPPWKPKPSRATPTRNCWTCSRTRHPGTLVDELVDDQKVRDALKANGKKKVIVAGLWTEVCNTTFAVRDAGRRL
jgi:nicotinamidase-related amidase